MDNNLNMTGQDRLDALLFDIADEEDMKVDYAAMLDTVYKKAAARKKRTAFVKYGSMAAPPSRRQSHWQLAGCGLQ